jgi:1,4-dihydroxy-2-naphthoate octaprenyltransferase
MRTMWAGQRIPSATPNLPPIQPMFPPVHHVPIYIAAYRTDFLILAGQKADGYLARPAESIPTMERLIVKLREAALAAGRDERAVNIAGYLLTHVDKSRRDALNRAKREPFVIYMMSVLSNFSLSQVGFEPELRDRIAAAWRAEDYHVAANLIPDDMLDAFMLCGTPEEVAAGAARYNEAGMDTPILQPVLQEEAQIDAVLAAARLYGSLATREAAVSSEGAYAVGTTAASDGRGQLDDNRLSLGERAWRRLGAWYEITRPFSLTASSIPVAAAGALALVDGLFSLPLFLASLIGAVFLQIGTNITNEIYDVRNGIDSITSPRASHALLKGRVKEREAFTLVAIAFAIAILVGLWLIAVRGWPVVVLGLLGLLGGFGYTAPPLQYKYKAVGVPLVFLLMGPLMVGGAYYVITGAWSVQALIASIPVGLLVAAILHGNEWRDITEDARFGIGTLSTQFGRKVAHWGYVALVAGAYMALAVAVLLKALPTSSLLAMLSMPLLIRAIRASELGAIGQQRAIAKIDLETAQLHMWFGILLVIGLAMAGMMA